MLLLHVMGCGGCGCPGLSLTGRPGERWNPQQSAEDWPEALPRLPGADTEGGSGGNRSQGN